MEKITSQTVYPNTQSGSGDHSHLAIDFFKEIKKMGKFGEKYTQLLNEKTTNTGGRPRV